MLWPVSVVVSMPAAAHPWLQHIDLNWAIADWSQPNYAPRSALGESTVPGQMLQSLVKWCLAFLSFSTAPWHDLPWYIFSLTQQIYLLSVHSVPSIAIKCLISASGSEANFKLVDGEKSKAKSIIDYPKFSLKQQEVDWWINPCVSWSPGDTLPDPLLSLARWESPPRTTFSVQAGALSLSASLCCFLFLTVLSFFAVILFM